MAEGRLCRISTFLVVLAQGVEPRTLGSRVPYSVLSADSQVDSQADGQLRTKEDEPGLVTPAPEHARTSTGGHGSKPRGLQNRLRASTGVRSSSPSSASVHVEGG